MNSPDVSGDAADFVARERAQMTPNRLVRKLLRWPIIVVWIAVILTLGTSYFSLARTAPIIDPIILWFAPAASPESVYQWHELVRWSAHLGEYAALYAALAFGPMRRRPLIALALCIACASLDEGLQTLRPDRSALIDDVALDGSGAAAVMLLALPRWILNLSEPAGN
jgi:VanZ family protein